MGLLKAYAIYRYGKKKGEAKYAEAIQSAYFNVKQDRVKKAIENENNAKCQMCSWERFRHGPHAECPVYPEMEEN